MKNWQPIFLLIAIPSIGLLLVRVPVLYPSFAGIADQQTRTYRLDPAQSKFQVNVYKAGWLKAFGHDHLIGVKDYSGTVRVSPTAVEQASVNLQFTTDSFTVLDPMVKPTERQEIERDMKSEKVLHVTEYPHITFISTRISDVKPASDGVRLTLVGDLTLHGVTRQVAVPVLVKLTDASVRAQGEFELKQTHYGITPISVKAALGGIRVKDEVKIVFDLTAQAERSD
jgi:polyisoprenoid-binding protein YceI